MRRHRTLLLSSSAAAFGLPEILPRSVNTNVNNVPTSLNPQQKSLVSARVPVYQGTNICGLQYNAKRSYPTPPTKHPPQQQTACCGGNCGGKTTLDPWFAGTLLCGLPVVFLATLVRAALFRNRAHHVNRLHVGQALPRAHPQCFFFWVRNQRYPRGRSQ